MSDEPRRALLELARVAGLEPDYTSWRNEPGPESALFVTTKVVASLVSAVNMAVHSRQS